jgi:MFS family permease
MSSQTAQIESKTDIHPPRFWTVWLLNYGWGPILVGAIAMAATYPGRTHGLGMVIENLLVDLKLDTPEGRVFFASLNFWGTLIGALFCLPVGWLFDRCDHRLILIANLILLGLSVLWMSMVHSWQALFASLILTRGLGQSALSVVSLTIVAKSFDGRRIGLAMAWYAILSVPFHLVLIKGVGWALTDCKFDWRSVWGTIGLALMSLSLLAFCLAPRNEISTSPSQKAPHGSTLAEALATPAFWVFSLTISLWGMIYAGVALFNVDIFKELGFDEKIYFNVLSLTTAVALVSKLFFGWLINYISLNRVLAACLLITSLSLTGLPLASQPWHAYTYGVCIGVASGAVALLFFATWGKLFGQAELGRIQGVAQMLTVFASASGPLLFSYSKQVTMSYTWIFQMLAAIVLFMAFAAWFTPLPPPFEKVEGSV